MPNVVLSGPLGLAKRPSGHTGAIPKSGSLRDRVNNIPPPFFLQVLDLLFFIIVLWYAKTHIYKELRR